MVKDVNHEKCVRKTFAKTEDSIEMPNLIQVQKDSYNWFVEEGLGEVLRDISPIEDYTGNLSLEFFDYYMEEETKYSLVRSPGCYYTSDYDKTGKKIFTSTVMPIRGAWIEYETDSNDIFYVRIDRTRKLPVTCLLRAIGLETDAQILEVFGEEEKIIATINKDTVKTADEAIVEIYKKLRPGELPSVDAARSLFNGLFFDDRRYDLAKVGRYKFNKKLGLARKN